MAVMSSYQKRKLEINYLRKRVSDLEQIILGIADYMEEIGGNKEKRLFKSLLSLADLKVEKPVVKH